MSAVNRCPRCGTELSSGDAQGLCPRCLLQVGMESHTATGTSQPALNRAPEEVSTQSLPGGVQAVRPTPKIAADLPEPGQQFGNYRLIRSLGKGGMGAVFEADDLASGRRVALKLLAHSLESPEARNRFFREGRLAASINHPNSVYVYGTEEIDGTPAISMEHVLGGTLHDRIRQRGPLPVTEAVDAILQIIDGLEAAAAVGVLHRDIKPSNCFIDADGTVKIGDFGLSISTAVRGDAHLTAPGSFLGTPAFSSPEQLRGDEIDIRSDIYAVGVTLFYLLTGRTPYEADNLVKLLATVLEQPAPSPDKFRPEIPQGLAKVVLRCLAKQPSDRFRNYAGLREALLPYNSAAPTPATLAWRFAAGLCDQFLWMVPVTAAMLVVFRGDFSALTDPALLRSPGYIAAMLVALLLPLFMAALTTTVMHLTYHGNRQHPELPELQYCLMHLDWKAVKTADGKEAGKQPPPAVDREALETYIAGKFRPVITDRKIWNSFLGLTIPQPQRKLAERIVAERPAPSAAELAQAAAKLGPVLKKVAEAKAAGDQLTPAVFGAIQFVFIWFVFVTLAGLITVAAFRRGLVMLAFGVDCVTRRGALASRPRMLWRTVVFNAPVLSAPLVWVLVSALVGELLPSLLAVAGALAVLAVGSSLLPTRGLADRLSGTYPVPR